MKRKLTKEQKELVKEIKINIDYLKGSVGVYKHYLLRPESVYYDVKRYLEKLDQEFYDLIIIDDEIKEKYEKLEQDFPD